MHLFRCESIKHEIDAAPCPQYALIKKQHRILRNAKSLTEINTGFNVLLETWVVFDLVNRCTWIGMSIPVSNSRIYYKCHIYERHKHLLNYSIDKLSCFSR